MQFIADYANYKTDEIRGNKLMQDHIKQDALIKIDNAVADFYNGFITVDECILKINRAEKD